MAVAAMAKGASRGSEGHSGKALVEFSKEEEAKDAGEAEGEEMAENIAGQIFAKGCEFVDNMVARAPSAGEGSHRKHTREEEKAKKGASVKHQLLRRSNATTSSKS